MNLISTPFVIKDPEGNRVFELYDTGRHEFFNETFEREIMEGIPIPKLHQPSFEGRTVVQISGLEDPISPVFYRALRLYCKDELAKDGFSLED